MNVNISAINSLNKKYSWIQFRFRVGGLVFIRRFYRFVELDLMVKRFISFHICIGGSVYFMGLLVSFSLTYVRTISMSTVNAAHSSRVIPKLGVSALNLVHIVTVGVRAVAMTTPSSSMRRVGSIRVLVLLVQEFAWGLDSLDLMEEISRIV